MKAMPYVCLYADYEQTLAPFTDEERGRILMAMLRYLNTGENTDFTGNERFIWPTLCAQLQRDRVSYEERCEKNRLNGRKGGRPRKEDDDAQIGEEQEETEITDAIDAPLEETEGFCAPSDETESFCAPLEKTEGFSEKPKKANKNKNENNNENKNESENENKNESESENGKKGDFSADEPPARPRFVPPKEAEILAYCREKGYTFDHRLFMDHYLANGWRVGKNPMRDWKAALRNWNVKEREYGKTGNRNERLLPGWTVGLQL